MPFSTLRDQTQLYFDDIGTGSPILLLHGGLGRYIDWFNSQIEAFDAYRLIIPDRLGYGRSTPVDHLPIDYHGRNAHDMFMLLDDLSITDAILWGHSDGAIIAACMAIKHPHRVRALIVEGTHLWRHKPASLEAFGNGVIHPEGFLSERAIERLEEGQGKRWRQVVANWGSVWLALNQMEGDLYDGRLPEIHVPTLVLHGIHDPHTSVTEIESLTAQIPGAQLQLFDESGHSPHSERDCRDACNRRVKKFLEECNS
jgi:pimeloyl-ACP methyl ester carboxylesterase